MAKASRRNGRPAATAGAQVYRELEKLIAKNTAEILAGHESNYRSNRDPFAAWGAFLVCRQHGREIPSWVWRYFEESGQQLHAVYRAAHAKRPVLLARALGFTRKGRPRSTADPNHDMALAVGEARTREGSLKAAKYAVVSAWGLSFETADLQLIPEAPRARQYRHDRDVRAPHHVEASPRPCAAARGAGGCGSGEEVAGGGNGDDTLRAHHLDEQ